MKVKEKILKKEIISFIKQTFILFRRCKSEKCFELTIKIKEIKNAKN